MHAIQMFRYKLFQYKNPSSNNEKVLLTRSNSNFEAIQKLFELQKVQNTWEFSLKFPFGLITTRMGCFQWKVLYALAKKDKWN